MTWDERIERFLDAHQFRGFAREKMKENLLRLPSDKRARFIQQRLERTSKPPAYRTEPTPHPAPMQAVKEDTRPFGDRGNDGDQKPCELCGRDLGSKVFYILGRHFPDDRDRGYFCSTACRGDAYDHGHCGSPHAPFQNGDRVELLDDLWMMDADETYEDEHPKGTPAQVINDPARIDNRMCAVGKEGSMELPAPYQVVSLLCEGKRYDNVYVGGLCFVRHDKVSLLNRIFG
jgi:hypothetical protein